MEQAIKVEKYVTLAAEINKNILAHGAAIWSGFTSVPFIIYTNEFQIAVGDKWPAKYEQVKENIWIAFGTDSDLMANTVISYHDQVIAIWDIRTWPEIIDIAQATGDIFHEMFHEYQYVNLQIQGGNELLAPTYPHSKNSVALTLSENELLLSIIKNPDSNFVLENLSKISKLRSERQAELGEDYLQYDQGIETGEGTAVYAEIQMVAKLSGKSIYEVATEYAKDLQTTESTLLHYRRRLYTVGLILCLACDILKLDLENEMVQSDSTIFAWLKTQVELKSNTARIEDLVSEESLNLAEALLTTYELEKEQKISAFIANPVIELEGELEILMFDPMNIVCHQGRCLHKHGRIKVNGEERYLEHPFLVEYEDHIFNIKKFFVPEDANV